MGWELVRETPSGRFGVGVTDKYVYTGDSKNHRLLRAKIAYAAEESVAVK